MKKIIVMILVACISLLAQEKPKFEYVGVNKCKMCHSSKKRGAQYKKWMTTKHAKSFEALLTDEAKKIVESKGIKKDPHLSGTCLKCHVTGWGQGGYEIKDEAFWNPSEDDREGKRAVKRMRGLQSVGCEACHGPGSAYKSKKVMDAVYQGTTEPASVGLVLPNETICMKCHNKESPNFKGFNFQEMKEKISHSYPAEMGQE